MEGELPDPPVPADCDLRDFRFMPLEIERLRRSRAWLVAKRRPELAFYMLNLWMAAWHEVPTASLEDDDDVLADAAICDPKKWRRIRDDVLRGWVKCSDGRLYHSVVAEKAADAWNDRLAYRSRTAAARAAKRQRNDSSVTSSVTDVVTALKGEGEGKGECKGKNLKKASPSLRANGFDEWWKTYPHKVARQHALRAYTAALKKISPAELLAGVERYKATKPENREWCNPATWLNGERWLDSPAPKTELPLPLPNGHDCGPRAPPEIKPEYLEWMRLTDQRE